MKKAFFYLVTVVSFVSLLTSCSQETEVGAGLLGSEDLSIDFRDDFDITAQTILPKSIVSYFTPNYMFNQYVIGDINDPIFGRSTSTLALVPLVRGFGPNLADASFDSIVLFLNIDTTFEYGPREALHDIEVFQVIEPIDTDTIFSDRQFLVNENPIGRRSGVRVALIDSIDIPVVDVSALTDSTARVPSLLDITLDHDFGQFVFDNIDNFTTTEDIKALVNGLEIRSTSDNGMFAVNLSSSLISFRNSMSIYYRDSSNTRRVYTFPFGDIQPRSKRFTHDLTGTPIEPALDQPVTGAEPLYIKGIGGPRVMFDVSDAMQLEGTLVNFASIEFFVATDIDRDTILYPDASSIAIQKRVDGKFVDIVDLITARFNGNQVQTIFGGVKEINEDRMVFSYKMNLTTYIKEMLKGRETGELFLTVLDEVENPTTAIVYGPNHPTFPAKLNITYTNP